jgi:hypothetical protein
LKTEVSPKPKPKASTIEQRKISNLAKFVSHKHDKQSQTSQTDQICEIQTSKQNRQKFVASTKLTNHAVSQFWVSKFVAAHF